MVDTGPLAALSASLHLPFYREVRVLARYRTLRRHPISGGTRLLTEACRWYSSAGWRAARASCPDGGMSTRQANGW
jgi:hypothetical protein